ncbi:F-box domain-containing protein [Mycena kentingensis (nom. inval.)]|nr:F-box domain-containing protein [Mycena kentingensis (nom. inval.)]
MNSDSLLERIVHPISTIPEELLAEIFVQYLPPYPVCPPLAGDGSPTKLSHICSSWRAIALSTPRLWRAIKLFEGVALDHHIEILQLWLELSGVLPLSIVMVGQWEGYCSSGFVVRRRALAILLANGDRWEYARLQLPRHDEWILGSDLQIQAFGGRFSRLREFNVKHSSSRGEGCHPIERIEAPSLRAFFFETRVVGHQPKLKNIVAWAQLARLTLRFSDVFTAAQILRAAVSLVHCRLDLRDADAEAPLSQSQILPIVVEKLQTLVLDRHPNDSPRPIHLSRLLSALNLPSLQQFGLSLSLLAFLANHTVDPFAWLMAFVNFATPRVCLFGLWDNDNTQFAPREDVYRERFPTIADFEISIMQEVPTSDRLALRKGGSPPVEQWGYWDLTYL